MIRLPAILPAAFMLLLAGCYYDVEEELYPASGTVCDTVGITYAGRVRPLLESRCFVCHSATAAQGNVVLEGYLNVLTYAQNGKLMGTVSHQPGYSTMPQGGNKLQACDIAAIKYWIDQGSPEN